MPGSTPPLARRPDDPEGSTLKTPPATRWDVVCRVVDNLGDAAVMWRLARQLAVEHGRCVRLFIDQPEVLKRLVPAASIGARVEGVAIHELADDRDRSCRQENEACDADVVVAGFHAELPESYRCGMAARPPVWINLEYLSAEDWIERFHGLPSPQADGLTQYFFYPGFTLGSGGLLRESDLMARRDAFRRHDGAVRFFADLGVRRLSGETTASILCYPHAPLDELARQLCDSAVRLHLVVPQGAVAGLTGAADTAALGRASHGRLRITPIPFLAQRDYDQLLWSCDLNFVRGEDSLVRAIWSGNPFVWQIYPQAGAAHLPKLEAFLRLLPGVPLADATRWWNHVPGVDDSAMLELLSHPQRASNCLQLLAPLSTAADLSTRLTAFVHTVAASRPKGTDTAGKL